MLCKGAKRIWNAVEDDAELAVCAEDLSNEADDV